jgi:DinB superfamily
MAAIVDRTETADYYFRYIDQVGEGDICRILEAQFPETLTFLRSISDATSLYRYAPGKWSIRETVSHLNDTERLIVSRAFWFARGFEDPLPSFDQNQAIATAGADERSWTSHLEEFRAVRAATLTFFQNLPADAWSRRGIASGNPFTVRALAYIAAGHVTHHVKILRERYMS